MSQNGAGGPDRWIANNQRRRFLKLAGVTGVVGLAGCLGDDDDENGDAENGDDGDGDTENGDGENGDDENGDDENGDDENGENEEDAEGAHFFGYYPGWARDRDVHPYAPDDVPLENVTDVLYAFLDVDPDGTVRLDEQDYDVHEANLEDFAEIAADNPDTNFHLSIGGWTLSGGFPEAAATEENRNRFAETAIELMREYNFDGIDLDWEHPGQGGNDGDSSEAAPDNHVDLLETCRERLDDAESEDGREYELSAAVSTGWAAGDLRHESIADVCDHVFLMTYDYTGTWADVTSLNGPLNAHTYEWNGQLSVEDGVNLWLDNGADPEALALGLPFYGRSFANVPSENDGIYQPYDGTPEGTIESGVHSFWDIEDNIETDENYEKHRHDEGEVPWLYSESEEVFISYDDAHAIREKVEFALDHDMAGVMAWELAQDRNETLQDAVNDVL